MCDTAGMQMLTAKEASRSRMVGKPWAVLQGLHDEVNSNRRTVLMKQQF